MATKKKSAKKTVKKVATAKKKGGVKTSADTGGDRPPVPPGKA